MWSHAVRWAIIAAAAALLVSGCTRARAADEPSRPRAPIVDDPTLVHAFDTELEARLLDRIELDTFLRRRNINVTAAEGLVTLTGEVWTPLEKQRVTEMVRSVAGVVDVDNQLDVRPPR